jgi:hypothetical protein
MHDAPPLGDIAVAELIGCRLTYVSETAQPVVNSMI